jgi:glycosyltransferase involved in cell wall biosynthesis
VAAPPGRLSQQDLIDLYRRAWLLTSASAREGWGMTITEAAACGTPAVVSDINGHADAVVPGHSGMLAEPGRGAREGDGRRPRRRRPAGAAVGRALEHSATLSWAATARGTLQALADEANRRRRRR